MSNNAGSTMGSCAPAHGSRSQEIVNLMLNRARLESESDKLLAAQKTLGWLNAVGKPTSFIAAAQRLIYLKGTDSHDYKFSSAVIEDYLRLSPKLRNRFLAASVFWLKGSGSPDSALVARTRAAL